MLVKLTPVGSCYHSMLQFRRNILTGKKSNKKQWLPTISFLEE
jgi:hypothetical protein